MRIGLVKLAEKNCFIKRGFSNTYLIWIYLTFFDTYLTSRVIAVFSK